ncbi:MAG: FlgD immunoglobulin-like domain containing protein [Desulfobacter postgatei]|uniref:FlgD immunoglobulin-like domain containing protein n=1 Tax=Desulfobacter postgatei TaxID=2293 RepID=UPI0023F47A2E|nr:FlgD immunoglobulin-like domain containing protein [Desulfobacter postgatei]MDD4273818.1 FlgD immunoglobulin-like domain containing protein [Desulfobacter postgatei]
MKMYKFLLVIIVSFFISAAAQADTGVTSISVDPGTINPFKNETVTFEVAATPDVNNIEIRILSSDYSTVIRSGLTLTESEPGIYTVNWDGTNNSNALVTAGQYAVRVFNIGTTTFIGPWNSITVEGLSIEPEHFIPTGTNAAEIKVEAEPGQEGLKLHFSGNSYSYWLNSSGNSYLPLTETSTPQESTPPPGTLSLTTTIPLRSWGTGPTPSTFMIRQITPLQQRDSSPSPVYPQPLVHQHLLHQAAVTM